MPSIRPVRCDVAVPEDCVALIERVYDETGRLDVLVNNAGASGPARIEDETLDDLNRVLAANLSGPFLLCKQAGERMRKQRAGIDRQRRVDPGAGVGGADRWIGVIASKGALVAMTRELAGQWGPDGVRVNALIPGWFRTEMNKDLFADEKGSKWVDRNTMLRRPGSPAELDGALLYLASDASSYMTGQMLVVDGGWTAR